MIGKVAEEVVSSREVRGRNQNNSSKAAGHSRLASLPGGQGTRWRLLSGDQVGFRLRRKKQSSGSCIP